MTETENTNNNNNSDNGGHDGNANNNSNNIYHPPPPLQQQQQVQNHTPQNNNNYNSNKSNNNNNSTAPRRTSLKLQLPDAAHRKAIEAEGGPRLTTTPLTPMPTPAKSQAPKKKKKKRRDKSDLGDNFVAPDGGWGWLVAIASGVNVLVTFAVGQQFGIIFRDWMFNLGITSSELTSIINLQIAVSAFTGLLNGPLFRRYSYRQVALVGSVLTFLGLFLSVFADSFVFYVCSFSCCYGFGRGLTVSASSLAVNTFFKQKRRTATAYQFGVAGMGPIFLPYFATFLLDFFGVQGTVLIFAGLSLHTIACSLIYQPVKWHVRKPAPDAELQAMAPSAPAPVEDEIEPVAEPETPTLARANDGWFGSRQSLNSLSRTAFRNRLGTWEKEKEAGGQMTELKRLNSRDGSVGSGKPRTFSLSHSIKEEDDDDRDRDRDRDREVQKKPPPAPPAEVKLHELDEEERKKLPFYKKVVIFFDLDLLRDVTYLNLAVGLTLINFVEINFAILTPFILSDFGFENHQIAMAMSSLGFCDLVIRFLIPAITANLTLSNKTLFIIGITGMCIGRAVLAFTRNFYVMMGVFVWLGLNKAARTVFWSLIIPSYVPLKRLPAAAGLQLLMSGVFSMACGPLIGMIRDRTNFAFTLNFLNAICILAVVMWILEEMFRKYQRKSKPVDTGEAN